MIVGQRTLYNALLNPSKKDTVTGRGRSSVKIDERNDLLCMRYFYYTYHKQFNYVKALGQLDREFFISQSTIINSLSEKQPALKKIFTDKPSVNDLRKLYDWLVWN